MTKQKMKAVLTKDSRLTSNTVCFIPTGVTLIELMLVAALMSVIFTVGATTLAFLMRVEMQGTSRIQKSLTLQKLSHQFREDANAAQSVEIISKDNNKNAMLKFEMEPGNFITYSDSQQGNFILRVKQGANKAITRNEYRISESSLQFGIEKLNQRSIVSMQFRIFPEEIHENKTVENPYQSFKIESLINRKHSIQDRIMDLNQN